MGFNDNLKGELEFKGMPVKELAHKTGIPKQTIDKYLLSNNSIPPADKAVLIAKTLGVTVEYLVTGNKLEDHELLDLLNPEMRTIYKCLGPLSRDDRKIIEKAVIELTNIICQSLNEEQLTFTPLQKIFLGLFRK